MIINRKQLLNALKLVSDGLAKQENIEQTTSFVFKDGRVFTYNDEITVSCPIDFEFEGAVPSNEFVSFISKLKSEEIDIVEKDGELFIKDKKAKAGIRFDTKISLPLDEISVPDKWKKVPKNFGTAIQMCAASVSKDQTRPVINCINIDEDVAESTDNYRITQYTLSSTMFNTPVLIPVESAKAIVKTNPTSCGKTKGWVHFKNKDDVMFSCRFIEDSFPDVSRIIIEEGVELVFPKTLSDILEKAKTVSDSDKVGISLDSNKITVSTRGSVGWFEETEKIKYKENPISFEIIPDHLSQMIKTDADVILTGKTLEFTTDEYIYVTCVFPTK